MEWYVALLLILGIFIILMLTGMPVAFSFIALNVGAAFFLWGGAPGLRQLVINFASSVSTFTLLPIPLFILMGEVLFFSNIAPTAIDTLDKWIGKVPGRLSFLAVAGGTLLSTLTGTSIASTAMLGSTLYPEMKKRGYKNLMALGPILGSGGLAIMIPPSSLAVLMGAIGEISIGRILLAIIVPGLLMAVLYAAYILIACTVKPDLAPRYETAPTPVRERLIDFTRYILPTGLIIFLVIGVIFIGVATPSEAAATGAIGTFILAAVYGNLNWKVVKKSVSSSVDITVMMLMILVGATTFSQTLAFTGASQGLVDFATSLSVSPIVTIWAMMIVLFFLGMFMSPVPIMMITLPLFMPIVSNIGFDTIVFGAMYLLNMEMATLTPPFGMGLFVMQSVAKDVTLQDCIMASMPYLLIDLLVMILIFVFPVLALGLPALMITPS